MQNNNFKCKIVIFVSKKLVDIHAGAQTQEAAKSVVKRNKFVWKEIKDTACLADVSAARTKVIRYSKSVGSQQRNA